MDAQEPLLRWTRRSAKFLNHVFSSHKIDGFVFLASRRAGSGRWHEYAFNLANTDGIEGWLTEHSRDRNDLYFCPNPFSCTYRRRENALSTPTAWCDLDNGDARRIRPQPNLLWETSPNRFQALWLWDKPLSVDDAEVASRTLTDAARGDKNGWSVTKYLRVPFTYNHKPQYDRPRVTLLHADWTPQPFDSELSRDKQRRRRSTHTFSQTGRDLPDFSTTFEKYRLKLHPRVRSLIRDKRLFHSDRSKCVYEIVCDLHCLGARFEEIASILKENVYFVSKYGGGAATLEREIVRIFEKLGDQT